MATKRHSAEQIVRKLREAEVELAKGATVKDACRKLAITEHTYYRWRREYGGLKLDQARRLKQLEKRRRADRAGLAKLEAAATMLAKQLAEPLDGSLKLAPRVRAERSRTGLSWRTGPRPTTA